MFERRRCERYPIAMPANFRIDLEGKDKQKKFNQTGIKGKLETVNISATGVCIRFDSANESLASILNNKLQRKELLGQSLVASLNDASVTIIGDIAWLDHERMLAGVNIEWNSNEREWLELCSITGWSSV